MDIKRLKNASNLYKEINNLNYIINTYDGEEFTSVNYLDKQLKDLKIPTSKISLPIKPKYIVPILPKNPTKEEYETSTMTKSSIEKAIPFKYEPKISPIKKICIGYKVILEENGIGTLIAIIVFLLGLHVLAFAIGLILELLLFPINIVSSSKLTNKKRKEKEKEVLRCKNIVEEYNKNIEKYEEDKKIYDEQYKNELKEYEEKVAEINLKNKEIERQNEIISKENDVIMDENEKNTTLYNKKLENHIKLYKQEKTKKMNDMQEELDSILQEERFPKSYLHNIDDIIKLLEDFRADSVKEAINLFEQEKLERERLRIIENANSKKIYKVKYRYYSYAYECYETDYKWVEARSESDAMAQVEGSISAVED